MEQREHWLDVSHHGNDPYCNTVSVKIFDVRLCACLNAANTVEVGSFTELVAATSSVCQGILFLDVVPK